MERVLLLWVSIRQCEVDGDREVNFAASKDILEEGVLSFDLELAHREALLSLLHYVVLFAFFELGESDGRH